MIKKLPPEMYEKRRFTNHDGVELTTIHRRNYDRPSNQAPVYHAVKCRVGNPTSCGRVPSDSHSSLVYGPQIFSFRALPLPISAHRPGLMLVLLLPSGERRLCNTALFHFRSLMAGVFHYVCGSFQAELTLSV